MQVTDERTAVGVPGIETIRPPRRAGRTVLILVLIAALIGGGLWVILQGDEKSPTEVVQDFAQGIRDGDTALLREILGPEGYESQRFLTDWLTALEASPRFTDCSALPAGDRTRVACAVTYGDTFFHAQVLDTELTGTITGMVDQDGVLSVASFPAPAGLTQVEAELGTWVRSAHPELEDDLYGSPNMLGIEMSTETGELRMQLLDEFVASRG